MGAFKNKKNGTWYVQFRYTDWKGERQQKLKRGFATKREAQEWERQFLMSKRADINMTFLHGSRTAFLCVLPSPYSRHAAPDSPAAHNSGWHD